MRRYWVEWLTLAAWLIGAAICAAGAFGAGIAATESRHVIVLAPTQAEADAWLARCRRRVAHGEWVVWVGDTGRGTVRAPSSLPGGRDWVWIDRVATDEATLIRAFESRARKSQTGPAMEPHLVGSRVWSGTPARPWHAAVCRVTAGRSAGSGALVDVGGIRGVLTAAHVVRDEASATCVWPDGSRASGAVTVSACGGDVAFVFADSPRVSPMPIAAGEPARGAACEIASYGGPESRFRAFATAYQGTQGRDGIYSAPVTPGDSGAAIVDASGAVVGVVQGGYAPIATGTEWPAYQPACGPAFPTLAAFAARLVQRWRYQQPGGS